MMLARYLSSSIPLENQEAGHKIKSIEEMMQMNAIQIRSYFISINASKKIIVDILESIGIIPSNMSHSKLTEFAAREISDTGMYIRVSKGRTLQEQ